MRPLVAMILDDDADFRLSLEMLVRREGFETRSAGSIAEARESLAADGAPDIFLIDLTLPDGDGLEWLRGEATATGTEVLVITGSTSVDNAVAALQAGAIAGTAVGDVRDEHAAAMERWFPRARRVTIKGAGHWVHSEQPEVFTEVLRRFLA